jgi:hypothetical protein
MRHHQPQYLHEIGRRLSDSIKRLNTKKRIEYAQLLLFFKKHIMQPTNTFSRVNSSSYAIYTRHSLTQLYINHTPHKTNPI